MRVPKNIRYGVFFYDYLFFVQQVEKSVTLAGSYLDMLDVDKILTPVLQEFPYNQRIDTMPSLFWTPHRVLLAVNPAVYATYCEHRRLTRPAYKFLFLKYRIYESIVLRSGHFEMTHPIQQEIILEKLKNGEMETLFGI